MSWEYQTSLWNGEQMTEFADKPYEYPDGLTLMEFLNLEGDKGWQLVNTVPGAHWGGTWFVFRREKQLIAESAPLLFTGMAKGGRI